MTYDQSRPLDSLVIGAGPAGIGMALALDAVVDLTYGVVERGMIGATFRRWAPQQRFLTPSFTANGFGAMDLNAVHPKTSPAFSLGVDYPSGDEYARYLGGVAKHFALPILERTAVTEVLTGADGFTVVTDAGPVRTRTLVWAGGEFTHPLAPRMPGKDLADHSSTRSAWEPRTGSVVVVGGFESGIDVACFHVDNGCHVTVVDPDHPWAAETGSDPSFRLAPRTRQRLAAAQATGRLTLVGSGRAAGIRELERRFEVAVTGTQAVVADSRPILATGFGPGLGPVADLFDTREDGWPLLDENDESTLVPALFLSGVALRHGGLKFCFVYKFRQRFAHVARVIGERLGKDCSNLEEWRLAGMLTDDLSCCGVECAC